MERNIQQMHFLSVRYRRERLGSYIPHARKNKHRPCKKTHPQEGVRIGRWVKKLRAQSNRKMHPKQYV